GLEVALRNDEQVHRSLGIQVLECEHEVVFVDDVRVALTEDDAAEHAGRGHRSAPVVYNRVVDRRPLRSLIEGEGDGYLPEVQVEDPQERQPRQARLSLVSQDVPSEGGAHLPMNDGAPENAGAPLGSNGGG